MLSRIVAFVYVALLLVFVAITPWAPAALAHFAFLACYLVLCHRHGIDAIRGSERSHPFVGTLLFVVPLAVVIGTDALVGSWPQAFTYVITLGPLALAISFWRRSRRTRRSAGRSLEGVAILATPVLVFLLVAWFLQGPSGMLMIFHIAWLEWSFGYAGSGIPLLIPASAASAVVVFLLGRLVLKRSLVGSAFLALLLVWGIGGYLLFVVYYDLPLTHTYEDVVRQPHTVALEMEPMRGAGRTLHVGRQEQKLYIAVKSTETQIVTEPSYTNLSGVLSYDVESAREIAFLPLRDPCITMVVEEDEGVLYSCDFTSRRLFALDLETLRPTGVEVSLPEPMQPEGLVRRDERTLLARFEIPGKGPDLIELDRSTLEWSPLRLPRRPLVVGCYALAVDEVHEKIFVPQLGNNVIVLNRLDWEGNFEAAVDLPGLTFEAAYSSHHDAVFVATLNRRVLYRVDAQTLEVSEAPLPNGIRSIRVADDGMLVIGDYIRGRIYLYDPDTRKILRTLLVGSKNQAMAVAPGSGRLFVYSSFGITIFDLRGLLAELHGSEGVPPG